MIFWNERAGSLVIQKKNSLDDSPLAGVQFLLTYADGSYVDYDNGHMSSAFGLDRVIIARVQLEADPTVAAGGNSVHQGVVTGAADLKGYVRDRTPSASTPPMTRATSTSTISPYRARAGCISVNWRPPRANASLVMVTLAVLPSATVK